MRLKIREALRTLLTPRISNKPRRQTRENDFFAQDEVITAKFDSYAEAIEYLNLESEMETIKTVSMTLNSKAI